MGRLLWAHLLNDKFFDGRDILGAQRGMAFDLSGHLEAATASEVDKNI